MPPKKKQQQIDLSTLPECHSINIFLLVKDRKQRAADILQRIQKEAEKYMFKIRRSEVLDHAKEKNIYIDPSTLTDKQKKDPKFMESVCTELTPAVVAKAVQSLISSLNIKIRMQKKNNPGAFANEKRKYDVMYVLEDFPEAREQFEELAKVGEGVKYLLVVEPKVTWANAPELPEENENEGQEEGEEDEDIKEYKNLLRKELKSEEDRQLQGQVDKKVDSVKRLRSQSSLSSEFRNCTISVLEHEVDPYNEENSLNDLVKAFFSNIDKLDAEFVEFEQWRKGKKGEPLPQKPGQKEAVCSIKSGSIVQMLNDLARGIDAEQMKSETLNDEEAVLALIEGYAADCRSKVQPEQTEVREQSLKFLEGNEELGPDAKLKADLRSFLRYPGINRHQMPEVSSKSEGLRKLEQAHYGQFLKNGMQIEQFFRRQRIANFQEFIKQFDQERVYSFSDRIFEEQHGVDSLRRSLFKATQFGEAVTFSKYDQSSDKLYVMMIYRNNGRRVAKRSWESNWKVVPNYEYWLKYFKNNEANLANTQFYDIDYEKIGNIEETVRTYTLKNGENGAVIIDKQCSAGNVSQKLLYALKNQLLFGVSNHRFYSQHESTKVYHHKNQRGDSEYESVIITPESKVRVSSLGNVMFEQGGETRVITPEGYTIVYEKERSIILHPSGGISYSQDTYVNERGFGLKEGHLFNSLTLERTAENGRVIKREDGTVIVVKGGEAGSKWIKFYEGTEYQIVGEEVRIEKGGFPFVTCQQGSLKVTTKDFNLTVQPSRGQFQALISFKDGSGLRMSKEEVVINQNEDKEQIKVDISANEILSNFDEEEIRVGLNEASYSRRGRTVDAREDEQKYREEDVLPADYIEPRLFVVNNDNTGVELLSQAMVTDYLNQNSSAIEKVYETKAGNRVECHVLVRADRSQEKFIKNELVIELDVFDNSKEQYESPPNRNTFIRTFIKYPPLSLEDIAEVNRVRGEVENWRKANLKEQNQFGHKPKDEAALRAKIQSKLLAIKIRQQRQSVINTEALRQKGTELYLGTLAEKRAIQEAKRREAQLRSQYLKKRDSVVRDFKRVDVAQNKKKREDEEDQVGDQYIDHYFLTSEGKRALAEMPDWVFRPKEIKQPAQLDPQIQNELLNATNANRQEDNSEDQRQRYDTVEVNINPREKEVFIKPSVFTQREIDEQRDAFESEKKAYKYHEVKRKDFNVYGQERKNRPEVRTLLRTQAISEINQKYLVTEAPLDKKVKISSMKNKLTSSASNMAEMRKEGPHSLLMKTLDKGNDINRLLEKRTMMVQADLNDKLQRDILIYPIEANFGVILEKRTYEIKIDIKNEDVISQRITLKRPKNIYVKVALSELGPVAMGMTRKITVSLKASSELIGKFSDQFDIVTKHQIYHIPITAHIVSENQNRGEGLQLNRGVIEVEQSFKKKAEGSVELPRLK